jgi:hypothetical protein
MAKNTGRPKKILSANEVKQHAPTGPRIFWPFGGRVGGVGIFLLFQTCSHEVLNGFLICSQSSQRVPQHVSWKEEITNIYILGMYKVLFYFICVMGQSKMPITKEE